MQLLLQIVFRLGAKVNNLHSQFGNRVVSAAKNNVN